MAFWMCIIVIGAAEKCNIDSHFACGWMTDRCGVAVTMAVRHNEDSVPMYQYGFQRIEEDTCINNAKCVLCHSLCIASASLFESFAKITWCNCCHRWVINFLCKQRKDSYNWCGFRCSTAATCTNANTARASSLWPTWWSDWIKCQTLCEWYQI